MSETLEKIRSRGYWRVKIRPDSFDAERVSSADELEAILHKTSVGFRGWNFPHLGKRQPIYDQNRVGQETDWGYYLESWQFYRSGQFVYQAGMKEDWHNRGQDPSIYNGLEPGKLWTRGKRYFGSPRFLSLLPGCSTLRRATLGCTWKSRFKASMGALSGINPAVYASREVTRPPWLNPNTGAPFLSYN